MCTKTTHLTFLEQQSYKHPPIKPINRQKGAYLCSLLNQWGCDRLLEIGSGIGFSAHFFAYGTKLSHIVSIEKQLGFFLLAKQYQQANNITFLWQNFYSWHTQHQPRRFFCVFLDAAKNHQEQMVAIIQQHYLASGGYLIIDNAPLVTPSQGFASPKKAQQWLKNQLAFQTYFQTQQTVFNLITNPLFPDLLICQHQS